MSRPDARASRPESHSGSPSPGRDADAREASGLNARLPSPGNRIAEYESALTKSTAKKSEGPVFEVIQKSRKANDKTCPILKVPNGKSSH